MSDHHGRFIVTRNDWSGPTVILGDWTFWAEHIAELDDWCEANGARLQGMTVEMTEEILMMFVLRWS